MPLMKLRGEQLKEGIIRNSHLAERILEANLDINWAGHYRQALQARKLVDFVQVNGVTVPAGTGEVDLTALGKIPASDPRATSNDLQTEGVIIDAPKNKAPLRNASTGEPVLGPNNEEVYGRVVFEDGAFKLKLVYFDGTQEVAFAPSADLTIDFQYARRFNLADVDELFAANEKFVEGAADITAQLNIVQLAKDIYGAGYQLDRTGSAKLAKSLVEQIAEEKARAQAAEQALDDRIDAETLARQQAITSLIADLASTATGKGASMIGIEDAAGKFAATTVEGALLELKNDIAALAGGSAQSISDLDARLDAVEAEIATARGTYDSLDARLDAIEANLASEASTIRGELNTAVSNLQSAIDQETSARQAADQSLQAAINNEVSRAQAAEANLQSQIASLQSDYNAHKLTHYKVVVTVTEATSVASLPADKPAFVPGNNSLDVYLNGVLQEAGVNYAELPDGRGVDFAPEVLQPGDKVIFRYYRNE